jgi:exosortase
MIMTIDSTKNNSLSPKDTVLPRKPWYLNGTWRFLLFNAVFAAAFFSPLRDLIRTAFGSEYDAYIPFIPFISAYLMYLNRQKIFSQGESSSAPGLIAMGAGILLLFFGRHQTSLLDHRDYQAIVTFAAVLIWIGGFALCQGIGSARAAVFPLMFLFFMVPIPGAPLEEIILFLQTGSAEVSYRFFQLSGVPVARDGFFFHLPGIDIEVAKECSGIRSSLSLVITGVLAAYLFLRTGWARVLLMLSIVPIAIVKNGIRIFTLSVLGVYWDRSILASDLHRKGGFIFFIMALVLAGAVMVLLRKAEARLALKNKKT